MSTANFNSLCKKNLIWDAHAGIFPEINNDLSKIISWHQAGVNYVSLNIGFDVLNNSKSISIINAYTKKIYGLNSKIIIIKNLKDIYKAKKQNKLAVSFDIEGLNALNNDLDMIQNFYDLGVRQMLFAYNINNNACGGCHDEDSGLTKFGSDVVEEMNQLGMIIDCSHVGKKSSLQIIEKSSKPVIFSHSNPLNLCNHERNIDDDQIKASADSGGVIGINGMGIFLGDNDVSEYTFADHICYIADLVGPEHVGFGLDWKPLDISTSNLSSILIGNPKYWPKGNKYDTKNIQLFSPFQLPKLIQILKNRGWDEDNLINFLGKNFERIAKKVWK